MLLPGGLWEDGALWDEFAFKPASGALELAVAEAGLADDSLPARVTGLLATCLDRLGARPVTLKRVAALCIADRQFLMRQLAALLDCDMLWLSADCKRCNTAFDFQITQSLLPVSPRGQNFPFADCCLDGIQLRLRVPNGADQEAIVGISREPLARQTLAWSCIVEAEAKPDPASLNDRALRQMETALEAVAPQAAVLVQTACPECGFADQVGINPYMVLQTSADRLHQEIHTLAINYHWDEATILALPRTRRQRYLELIDQARGITA